MLIKILDILMWGWSRRFYFDHIRGHFVKSYRITEVDIAEGIGGIELWRFIVEVRYKYTWYHATNEGECEATNEGECEATNEGECEAEGFSVTPKQEFIYNWKEAQQLMIRMVEGRADRELYTRTRISYRKRQRFSAGEKKVRSTNAY